MDGGSELSGLAQWRMHQACSVEMVLMPFTMKALNADGVFCAIRWEMKSWLFLCFLTHGKHLGTVQP